MGKRPGTTERIVGYKTTRQRAAELKALAKRLKFRSVSALLRRAMWEFEKRETPAPAGGEGSVQDATGPQTAVRP